MSTKCYIHQAVKQLRGLLKDQELEWFNEHPQFRHFFHMDTESSHRLMGMWTLLLRTVRSEKRKELWFVVNGTPIRYSLREMALISGLNCHAYPRDYKKMGSSAFKSRVFGTKPVVRYEDVVEKLETMKRTNSDRLKLAVLYFLSSVIIGKKKTGIKAPSVEPFFLRAVDDLELCKTFPWGRLAFDENMKDVFHMMEHFRKGVKTQWVFPSFVIPLELLAFEAIPNLMQQYRHVITGADPMCPRMCKTKFNPCSMKGIPISDLYDTLGQTRDIQNILVSSPDEEVLLGDILEDDGGMNDADDVVIDGWYRQLTKGKRQIWFEDLFNQDTANRIMPARNALKDVSPSTVSLSLPPPAVDASYDLVEALNALRKVVEDGFKEGFAKLQALDKRVKSLEEQVNHQREQDDEWYQGEGITEEDKENEEEKENKEVEKGDEESDKEKENKEKENENEEAEKEAQVVVEVQEAVEASLPAIDAPPTATDVQEKKKLETYKRKRAGKKDDEGKVRSPVMTRGEEKKKRKVATN